MTVHNPIQNYMTPMPHSIGKDVSLEEAETFMNTHGIRHLPVLEKGVLTGVITEKDIKLAKTINSQWDWKCEDVLTPNPRIVAPDAPIHRVLLEMAKTKDEYALIQHPSGNIIGIFTQIDAYLILARLLADFSEEQGITHNA